MVANNPLALRASAHRPLAPLLGATRLRFSLAGQLAFEAMRHLLLALHVLFAIFAVGPLVGAASAAARGIRAGDASAVAGSARTVRLYGYLSIVVPLLGMGLVQPKWHAKFSYPWVWISLVLYL